jgi:5-methylcytosine-specific restriction endonuclease McrA
MRTSSDWTINLNSINKIIEEQSWLCKNCWIDIKNNYHIDHIYPISKWWLHSIDNIQILCPSCNMKKSNKIITKY